jgi:pheromone shutdown-related protein TraB
MLAAYQRKLGLALGVRPGAELLEAGRTAESLGIPVALCDRDVRVTLRRAWASLSLWKKSLLLSTFLTSAFEGTELTEESLRELRRQDVLSSLMNELAEALPSLKRVLIDERDAYLAQKMRDTPGRRVVAVVGAGHVAGVLAALREPSRVDLPPLEEIPPVSPVVRWLGFGIPALIVLALIGIGVTQGAEAAARDLAYWVLVTGLPCTLGAAAAFAHPITIAAAFFTAPVTTLSPLIGAGHVLALVQAWVQPPLVSEFERVAEDVMRPLRWWRNRLLRIVLVFFLTTIGTMIGMYIGGWELVSKLVGGK